MPQHVQRVVLPAGSKPASWKVHLLKAYPYSILTIKADAGRAIITAAGW
ncbi:MAG TPA: hypothetical protein VGO69_11790 [Pyrinomonadaceae bacterium]|nr:hypothetical protein [Pyrinomonadaceae bacterium]